jgi:hypothetical protein
MIHSRESIAHTWGSTAAERAMPFPCDEYLPNAEQSYFRAVDVRASAAVLFHWLCQLKAAPYSYDWLDNGGRRSPRRLIPGLEQLATGQRVMEIFELVAYEPDRHLTLVLTTPRAKAIFGSIAGSYVVLPSAEQGCRLVVKLLVRYPRGSWSWMRWPLPWGDLVMMRKQLLTLKQLAEGDSNAGAD